MVIQKVLITGGTGMLATDIAAYLNTQSGYEPLLAPRAELDITNVQQIESFFEAYKPDIVINTAALMVEACETSEQKAYAVNAWGVRHLAQICQRFHTTLVQISTCGLFGDEVRPYHEYDPVQLKTVYARSKFAGERYTSDLCEQAFNLRIGWLYGGTFEHQRNFVVARYHEAQGKSVISSANDKYGSPTYTGDVAKTILKLIESQAYGTYHVANHGKATRADYVRHIVHEFGLETSIEEVDSSRFPRKADVPNCEWIESLNLNYAGIPALSAWQDALSHYIYMLKNDLQ